MCPDWVGGSPLGFETPGDVGGRGRAGWGELTLRSPSCESGQHRLLGPPPGGRARPFGEERSCRAFSDLWRSTLMLPPEGQADSLGVSIPCLQGLAGGSENKQLENFNSSSRQD